MKPLILESQDNQSLQLLGRASSQIVHDLKNQINGLKLYATFLRKRLEKSGRPADELETVNKLIKGLDRGADDLSMIGQLTNPVALKKQDEVDLEKLIESVARELNQAEPTTGPLKLQIKIDSPGEMLIGEFDPDSLTQALNWVSGVTSKWAGTAPHTDGFRVAVKRTPENHAEIEWPLVTASQEDPFKSMVGGDGVKLALASKIIEAHGGSATRDENRLRVLLPLNSGEHS